MPPDPWKPRETARFTTKAGRFASLMLFAAGLQLVGASAILQAQQIRDLPPAAPEHDLVVRSLPATLESLELEKCFAQLEELESNPDSPIRGLPSERLGVRVARSLPSTEGNGKPDPVERPPTKDVVGPVKNQPTLAKARRQGSALIGEGRERNREVGFVTEIPDALNPDAGPDKNRPRTNVDGNPLRQPGPVDAGPLRPLRPMPKPILDTTPLQSEYRSPSEENPGFQFNHNRGLNESTPEIRRVSFNSWSDELPFGEESERDTRSQSSASVPGGSGDLRTDSGAFVPQTTIQSGGRAKKRHPLASSIAVENDGLTILTAAGFSDQAGVPTRAIFQQPSIIESTELDLVQRPVMENRLNPYGGDPTQVSRDQFWRQFSTVPTDNAKDRTKGYESLTAIMSNGFWFGSFDLMYLEPTFQQNNAFTTLSGTRASAEQVDFGFDASFRGRLGFETNAGPAMMVSYWGLNNYSAINDVNIGAGQSAVTRIDLGDSGNQVLLGSGASAGSRLTVQQKMKIQSTELTIYKDLKLPVSRVRGNIGFRHVSLQQQLFAGLNDPLSGSSVVRNFNDYSGVGPRIGIEYFRPIGHTKLEFQAGLMASLLFGRRDQVFDLAGPVALQFVQIGKVETMSIMDAYIGVQWNRKISKCRTVFLRTALESQWWGGSDSALDTGSDLGLYGMSFGFGVSR